MSGLASIGLCLRGTPVRVTDLPEHAALDEPSRHVFESLGIDTVLVDEGSGSAELAAAAASSALAGAGVAPADVDALVVVQGRVPEYLMASEATKVQAELGAARATTFSVADLGCVSISSAFLVAGALLDSNPAWDVVLIAHGSKPPAPRRFRYPVTVNGDGGVGVVVTRDRGPRVLDVAIETNGEYWDLYRVDFKDKPHREWTEECKSLKTYSFKLAIESRNRFAALNETVLARAGKTMSDVDHFVMQNLSSGAFRFYEEFFKIEFAKACKTNLARYGHLGSMDVPLNLQTAIESGEASPGDLVLVMNNSPVAAWSTMLVEIA
ncbi:MAG TPA: 3-oxoacyl-[acyl-carrier-protein] synthase III C-terminal domain-containing protein [Actinomycetota bacterium]|nr:3-oxoacyl-[acyl-carrier-protein] synthase III C-terminal domain-containing protein [Actinomycetota bacterium]